VYPLRRELLAEGDEHRDIAIRNAMVGRAAILRGGTGPPKAWVLPAMASQTMNRRCEPPGDR
jgi:hypothetical protein